MAQIRTGFIRVVNGSNVVQHIWQVTLSGVTGTFAAGDLIREDDAGGSNWTATVTSYDAASKTLRFYITSGSNPVVGEVVETTDEAKSGTIAAIDKNSPPNYNTRLSGTTKRWLMTSPNPVYEVSGSGATDDSFELTSNWNEPGQDELEFGISVDFTTGISLPVPEPGDVDVVGLMGKAMTEIDRRLTFSGAYISQNASQAITGSFAQLNMGSVLYDAGGWANDNGPGAASSLKIPNGVTKVRGAYGFSSDLFLGDGDNQSATVKLRVRRNAASTFIEVDVWAIKGVFPIPVRPVNQGDVFHVEGYCSVPGGDNWDNDERTFLYLEAVELT